MNVTILSHQKLSNFNQYVYSPIDVPNKKFRKIIKIKEAIHSPNATLKVLNGGEKIILASENELSIQSDIDGSLDAVMSYVEIV